jgi:hypothetical protein
MCLGRTPVERGGVGAASHNRDMTFIDIMLQCNRQGVLRSTFNVTNQLLQWRPVATRRSVHPSEGTDVQRENSTSKMKRFILHAC